MAATRKAYRFLDLGSAAALCNDDHHPAFEFDHFDIYDSSLEPQRQCKPAVKRSEDNARPHEWIPKRAAASSLPVDIPDWSKILREEYRGREECRYDEEEEEECCDRLPPHEFLARTRARSVSLSGRSLKGRDLSRVRNAIWAKIGFQD